MFRITEGVKHLLILNVLFFIATSLYGDIMIEWFALWFPKAEPFGWWQFVSHMFMHGGPDHIFFNMLALWMFGTSLEMVWGKEKFLFFFFSAGIGAALVQTGVNYYQFNQGISALVDAGVSENEIIDLMSQGRYMPGWYDIIPGSLVEGMISNYMTHLVGASGATSGILAAFAFMYPERELFPIPIKVKFAIPILFLGDLYYGLSGGGGNIAYFAHIGGALFGLFMVWYWKKNQFNKNRWN
ncbi:rhomboid family intramembrane serine protease [Maribacter algarum]|uniref:Rhomboid family intramembrane serine protease n=1 Tax=Maribacter algarum (ex Zhang et al. 2020) TaxID=2578118 RepID=A0A5S3PHU9_9FLAO|nr:rhomboid family intramembrane serine protease [Maribacter algarum]TMM53854.1 rhomboid family intramembrane serine protease [Maribacter algarum]